MRPDVFKKIFETLEKLPNSYLGPWTNMKWREDLMDEVMWVPVRKPYTVIAAQLKLNPHVDEIIRRCSERRQAITDSSLPHEAMDSTVATDSDTAIFEASRLCALLPQEAMDSTATASDMSLQPEEFKPRPPKKH